MSKVRNWPPFLANPDTRASHLAILIVTSFIFVAGISVLVWAIYRTTSRATTDDNSLVGTTTTENSGSCPTQWKSLPVHELVDPFQDGYHWIGPGQSIVSSDCRFELGLTSDGNLVLWDHTNQVKLYESGTTDTKSPGQRFLVGIEGLCYIIRNDGSRVKKDGQFWQSPNQLLPYVRDPVTGETFYVHIPFVLSFYEDGLVLWCQNQDNTAITKSNETRINLWWVSASGVFPPGYPGRVTASNFS